MTVVNKAILGAVAIFSWALASPAAHAQNSINTVRIHTEPAGLSFQVDGQTFYSVADLPWPATSKHTVSAADQILFNTQYGVLGVFTNLSELDVNGLPITADPALKTVTIQFLPVHPLTLNLTACPVDVPVCPGGAKIEINGVMYDRRTILPIIQGSQVHARAFPNPGYIFTGWSSVFELGIRTEYDITFPMQGPLTLSAYAQGANSATGDVNILTNPPQLKVLLDRTPYIAPINLQWGWNTVHTIGTEAVQLLQGRYYVFDSWSDGGDLNHDVKVPNSSATLNYTANFVPGIAVGFGTTPSGLGLTIDGVSQIPTLPTYDYYWGAGTVHKISAPKTQTDAQGRRYRFVSWSNGQTADWTFTTGATSPADRIRAQYELVGLATLNTVPQGLPLLVDGASCDTPCTIEKAAGASVKISAIPVRNLSDRSRLAFQGWNDWPAADRTIVISADSGGNGKSYTATYTSQNRLLVTATPPEGALFTLNPASTDGFYDTGALVSIAVRLAAGYRVTSWTGDLSGTATALAVALDSPRSATLLLDRVPAIQPSGVRNAALGYTAQGVAAGSLISIFGANLAPALEIGPPSPLSQTLQNVSVRVDDTFLPLIFVSPAQINAQLASSVSEGTHKLIVRWEGKPETSTQVLVVRNAPGLFGSGPSDQPLGSFLRVNGQAVTADAPAHAGETVSILCTGLGPYTSQPPDGFLFDETSGYTVKDDVAVIIDDTTVNPTYAGRSGAAVALETVVFQLPATLPDTLLLPVKIRVNGQESNTVLLPISR